MLLDDALGLSIIAHEIIDDLRFHGSTFLQRKRPNAERANRAFWLRRPRGSPPSNAL